MWAWRRRSARAVPAAASSRREESSEAKEVRGDARPARPPLAISGSYGTYDGGLAGEAGADAKGEPWLLAGEADAALLASAGVTRPDDVGLSSPPRASMSAETASTIEPRPRGEKSEVASASTVAFLRSDCCCGLPSRGTLIEISRSGMAV